MLRQVYKLLFFGTSFLGVFLERFLTKKGVPRVPHLAQKSIKTVSQNQHFQGIWKSEKKWRFLRGPTSPKRCIYNQNQRFFTFSLDPVLSSKMPPKWGPWASQNEKKWCLKTDHFLVLFLERFLIKNDSKSDLKLVRKYIKKTSKNRSRSRGCPGPHFWSIFDDFGIDFWVYFWQYLRMVCRVFGFVLICIFDWIRVVLLWYWC